MLIRPLKVQGKLFWKFLVRAGIKKEFVRNKHKLPYVHVTNFVNELRQREDWVSKNIVNKAIIKYRKERAIRELRESLVTPPSVPNTISATSTHQSPSILSDLSNVSSTNSSMNIGRPVGSTEAKKRQKKKELIEAKNDIARAYVSALSGRE